jgi:hypothetical protein
MPALDCWAIVRKRPSAVCVARPTAPTANETNKLRTEAATLARHVAAGNDRHAFLFDRFFEHTLDRDDIMRLRDQLLEVHWTVLSRRGCCESVASG